MSPELQAARDRLQTAISNLVPAARADAERAALEAETQAAFRRVVVSAIEAYLPEMCAELKAIREALQTKAALHAKAQGAGHVEGPDTHSGQMGR